MTDLQIKMFSKKTKNSNNVVRMNLGNKSALRKKNYNRFQTAKNDLNKELSAHLVYLILIKLCQCQPKLQRAIIKKTIWQSLNLLLSQKAERDSHNRKNMIPITQVTVPAL